MGAYSYIESYVHGNRIGVLVHFTHSESLTAKIPEFIAFARDLAMHIAALSPQCINPPDIPAELRDRELAYLAPKLDSLDAAEKLNRIEKTNRRIDSDFCLMEQPFLKNPDLTVSQLLSDTCTLLNDRIEIVRFVRWESNET